MRKPRDYDTELKALEQKAKELKARKVRQLGELVIASGADNLPIEELAGGLISIAETQDASQKQEWAKRGSALFRGKQKSHNTTANNTVGTQPQSSSAQSPSLNNGQA